MSIRARLVGWWRGTGATSVRPPIEPADGSPDRGYLEVRPLGLDLRDAMTWRHLSPGDSTLVDGVITAPAQGAATWVDSMAA